MKRPERKPSQDKSANRAPIFHYYSAPQRSVGADAGVTNRATASRQAKPAKFSLKSLPSFLAAVLVVGALVGNLYISAVPVIKFGSKPAGLQSEDAYRAGIQDIMHGSILNRTKITINTRSLENTILQHFPEVSKAAVSLPLVGNQAAIGIEFNRPAFLVSAKNGNFIVGNDGRVMIVGDTDGTLPKITDVSGLQYEKGRRVMTPDDISALQTIFSEVQAQGLSVENLTIGSSPRDIVLKLSDAPYQVRLNFMYDIRQQLGALWTIREQIASGAVVAPSEYIDVRLGERVFLK